MLEEYEREQADRKSRENNMIIFRVPEADTNIKEERIQKDTEALKHTLEGICEVEMDTDGIQKLSRLGKKREDGAPRALIVTFEEGVKPKIFRGLTKLREAPEPYKSMSFVNDLTKKQREEDKKLQEEARVKQAKEKSGNWTYRVKGPPWRREIRRIRTSERRTPQVNEEAETEAAREGGEENKD